MPLQAVIIERVILSGLITLVAAIATSQNGSSIDGFSFLSKMTPFSELEGIALEQSLDQTDYAMSQNYIINTQINLD